MIEDDELNEKCDYDPCHCVPAQEDPVVEGKSVYCSTGCKDGVGCEHEDCDCSNA